MRKFLVFLFTILIITASLTALYFKFKSPRPTPFNWQGSVITIAGDGSPAFRDVARPREAGLSDPFGVSVSNDGTVYFSDAGESNRIRKLTPDGYLTTLAGGSEGFADGSQASFNTPSAIALDADENLLVADTANNRIRKVTPEGVVTTVAGNGIPGFADGEAATAQFNGPVGVSVDKQGNIYVADTYNDRIRKITIDGQVSTVAGGRQGDLDGDASNARFDTPCAVVSLPDGSLIVADTGNNKLRKIDASGQVTTLAPVFENDPNRTWLRSPVGLALTHDGFIYVTEFDRGTVVQIAPDGKACVLAGSNSSYAEGPAHEARFNHPTGIAVNPKGGLVVADSANYLVRKITTSADASSVQTTELPRLTPETLGLNNLLWPLDPQDRPHEVVATMGEVRGSFDSTDSRDHLHSGLDVSGAYGDVVRAIRPEKVTSPLPNWAFDQLSEGLRVGVISYIHIHVGRDKDANMFNDARFNAVKSDDGKLMGVRIKRGTRFKTGEAIGTVNRMYHVHLIVGPSGGEVNPLLLSPIGFKDTIAPTIEKDGIQIFDERGTRLIALDRGRLIVRGRVSVVVDAFDRTDMNSDRRRLGLYSVGYQLLQQSNDAPVFPSPQMNILFNRLPPEDNATKVAYAGESGITVYGSKETRFLYQITNTIRDGHATTGLWDTSAVPKGDYVLRIVAADYSGNEAQENRDLLITIK
jgi:sugar lactone lactonase YvrE